MEGAVRDAAKRGAGFQSRAAGGRTVRTGAHRIEPCAKTLSNSHFASRPRQVDANWGGRNP